MYTSRLFTIISNMRRYDSVEVRAQYQKLAKEEKSKHAFQYSENKWSPRKSSEIKKRKRGSKKTLTSVGGAMPVVEHTGLLSEYREGLHKTPRQQSVRRPGALGSASDQKSPNNSFFGSNFLDIADWKVDDGLPALRPAILRQTSRQPTQYLHLLRAGYFELIPVTWANLVSNPLKFSIEASAGWRGINPTWRGFEDTAEERLYWVLNHKEGSVGMRMKPNFISTMNMARARMASAVEPPPAYFSPGDICHLQHTSEDYSKQVMPLPFRAFRCAGSPYG